MPAKKIRLNIPERSLTWLFLCLSGILFTVLVVLFPRQHSLRAVELETESLKEQLEMQNALTPIYGTLKDRTARQQASVLPYPRKIGLHRDRIALLPVTLSEVAGIAGLQTIQVSPELSKLNGPANSLSVNLIHRGEFGKFRNYLVGLGNLSFLERIEEIRIDQTPDGLEYSIRVKLAIE